MSSRKAVLLGSLGTIFALATGVMVVSEVRAGDDDDFIAATVDGDTLAQANEFVGDYTFVGGQAERDGFADAVETSMEGLAPMLRGIGRKRLLESNPIPKGASITLSGEELEILFDGDGHAATLDGTPVRTSSAQGDKIKVSHRIRGSKLIELLDGDKGDRLNTFKLNSDGSRLTLDVEISSSHLPVPVVYTLTFKRK